MMKILCTSLLATCATVSIAAAEPARPGPTLLTPLQMDAVTAGADVAAISSAVAVGSFAIASTAGAGVISHTADQSSGAFSESGVALGTAAAVAAGPGAGTATGVTTSGSVNGTPVVDQTVNVTVAAPSGQVSGGFTYVSGGTQFSIGP